METSSGPREDLFGSPRPRRRWGRAILILALSASVPPFAICLAIVSSTSIGSMVFSPDGRSLAAGVGGLPWLDPFRPFYGVLKVWDVQTGSRLARLHSPVGYVRSVAFSADGLTLAVAGDSPEIELWSSPGFMRRGRLVGHAADVQGLRSIPGRAEFASTASDGTVRVWDVSRRAERLRLGVADYGTRFVLSPDGRTIVTDDATIRFWDLAEGHLLRTIGSEEDSWRDPFFLTFTNGGSDFLLGKGLGHHGEGFLILDGETRRELGKVWRGLHCRGTPSPDGRGIASGDSRGEVQIHEARTGAVLLRVAPLGAAVEGFAFSPDGSALAVALDGGSIAILDIATGAVRRRISAAEPWRRLGLLAGAIGASVVLLRMWRSGKDAVGRVGA